MKEITLRSDFYSDVTFVPNYFLDHHMMGANEAQVKIYLYLLRCMNTRIPVSVSALADQFNYTEKDVVRALKYWEKRDLLSLKFDDGKNISDIILLPCVPPDSALKQPAARAQPAGQDGSAPQRESAPQSESLKGQIVAIPALSGKPSYSREQWAAFSENEDIRQLLFITEQYMQKPLSSSDTQTLFYIYDELRFPADLIEYLIEYCVSNNHKSMRYIEKVALSWAQEGISTVGQARLNNNRYRKEYYDILKAYGLNLNSRRPADSEIAYIKRWTDEYGFDKEIIIEACSRTISKIHEPNFDYTDGILKSWKAQQVHHASDIRALDELHRQNKPADGAPKPAGNNKFNNFNQRSYDYDALEKELLSN